MRNEMTPAITKKEYQIFPVNPELVKHEHG
jgi:predicted CoA-binding protein